MRTRRKAELEWGKSYRDHSLGGYPVGWHERAWRGRKHNRDRLDIIFEVLTRLSELEDRRPVSFTKVLYWSQLSSIKCKQFLKKLEKDDAIEIMPMTPQLLKQYPELLQTTKMLIRITTKGEVVLKKLKALREIHPLNVE